MGTFSQGVRIDKNIILFVVLNSVRDLVLCPDLGCFPRGLSSSWLGWGFQGPGSLLQLLIQAFRLHRRLHFFGVLGYARSVLLAALHQLTTWR